MEFLAKGKRGIVYIDRESRTVTKTINPKSTAQNRLAIEADFLKKLNEQCIGPKFIAYENGTLTMEFIDGDRILDYLRNNSTTKKDTIIIIKKIFDQAHQLDILGINKLEMTNPYKHIIIRKKPGKKDRTLIEAVMIDFERCRYSKKPKNVTQFVQFLVSANVERILQSKRIFLDKEKILAKARGYKKELNRANYQQIITQIRNA
jgi:putative serine/threonine protein kinase